MRAAPRPACYLCGTPGVPLYSKLSDGVFGAPGQWSLARCPADNCGLLWLNPMPLPEDLPLAYDDYYTHGEPVSSGLRAVGKFLFGVAEQSIQLVAGIPLERRRAALMYLGSAAPARLLDVGCGDGRFLAAMAQRGWKVSGIDFDANAVEAARTRHGLDVRVATIESVVEAGETFDVVTASHVIEHVPDPVQFLASCRRALRPGGRVILKTPNANSFGARRYGPAWRGLEPPRHLHIFTLPALASCASKAGFSGCAAFTTPVGADGILIASRFLERRGTFRPDTLTRAEKIESRLLRPWSAIRAKWAWDRDKSSGEEICATLSNEPGTSG